MICHCCGSEMEKTKTDLPFKIGNRSIIVLKNLPVSQCKNCSEYLIEDSVMEEVDNILDDLDKKAELEIVRFAA